MALTKVSGSILKDPLNLGGEVSIGGTLTYQDVTNVDAIGIITARAGINVSGGQLDVGNNIKLGNAGVITATSFSGDGSNLTGIAADKIFEGNTKAEVVDTGSDGKFVVETEGTQRLEINSTGNVTLGTAADAGNKLYFQSTSGAAQYIASGGTNNRDLIFGSSSGTKLTIDEDGSVLIIGNSSFTPVDTRNVGGIHIRDNRGISFKAWSGSTASRNWRIRNDDLSNFGDLNISCGNNNTGISTDSSDLVMTFTKERNVIIGDTTYGSSLGQLRINNDASSTPASFSLFGYGNTNTGDVFAKIDFASQENSTNGQVTAGIEAQAVGTAERAADLVFKTRPDTSGSSAIERVRMSSSGTTTISGVPAFGAISKTASSDSYVDIFVYDTRKDSDGGAWRHRTNNTSWYNETLNTSIRGSRRDFPQVAIVAVGNNYIHIFDADDPDMPMWMKFPAPSGGARNVMYGTGNPRCVFMLNGILCTGSQATNFWPVVIDFIRDDIVGLYSSTGHIHYSGRQGNISLRDAATSDSGKWWPGTVNGGSGTSGNNSGQSVNRWWFGDLIVSNHVTSVVMSVRPEAPIDKTTGMQIPTIYFGTRGGVSIVHSNVGDTGTAYHSGVYDITSNNGPYSAIGDITITDEGFLWAMCDSYLSYASYRDSIAIDLKRLDNQMNNIVTRPDLDEVVSGLNDQAGGNAIKGREYYWVSTGNEGGSHKIGYANTWSATTVERNAWGCAEGFALHTKPTYDFDHKEYSSFFGHADQNRALVAMITKDYNTGWHMTGTNISVAYIADGLTSNISSGAAAMLDRGHTPRHLDVVGTLTRAKCATGSDLSCVSGFSSSNYVRIINASINAGNPPDITMMGWIKITDIGGYSYLCSIATGSDGMGIAVHASSSANGGKPYFYDNQQSSLVHDKGINDGEWHHVCGVRECSSNRKLIYVDGVRGSNVQYPSNADYTDLDTIAVGHWCETSGTAVSYSCRGSLALVKIGLTGLTDEQVKKIYEDEKKLFQPNAKAFIYGSSSAVTAIGYDEKKDIYHIGTSSGRSDFSGLSRINNTTTAVTTAISAYDGLIAEQ